MSRTTNYHFPLVLLCFSHYVIPSYFWINRNLWNVKASPHLRGINKVSALSSAEELWNGLYLYQWHLSWKIKKNKKIKKSCSSITVICLEKFVIFKQDTSTLFSLPIEEKNVIQNSSLLKTIFRRCRLPSNFFTRFQQNCLIIFDKLEMQLFCCQLNRVKTHHKAPARLSMLLLKKHWNQMVLIWRQTYLEEISSFVKCRIERSKHFIIWKVHWIKTSDWWSLMWKGIVLFKSPTYVTNYIIPLLSWMPISGSGTVMHTFHFHSDYYCATK